ncbi:MAG: branched-chain amino acid transport system substrate-binding protein [Frankiaceae bacterium]|nr:branched-chain amino acid transport system substrate-binding protein [Frankiaceae bacterium]
MPASPRRLALGLLALSLTTAACGLKPTAYDSIKQNNGGSLTGNGNNNAGSGVGNGGTTTGGGTTGGGGTTAGGTTGGGFVGGGTTGGGTTGGGTTGGGTTGGNTGGGTNGGPRPQCSAPTGGDTTGISASNISIGVHAPISGTGTPFPNNSFIAGAQTYWKTHKVCGRTVTVEVLDDTYKPSGAHAVCQQMAKRDFMVIGAGGTDQIQACATDSVIQKNQVPYLSAGVTTNGLTSLNNYFALSLTYQQQGDLVVNNAKALGVDKPAPATGGKKKQWAIVTAAGPNFEGARKGIESALSSRGITYEEFTIDQSGNYQQDAQSKGSTLALDGYKTIFVDLAPGYFVFMAGGYYAGGSGATWVGPGVTFTEVTVAQYLCTSTHNSISGHAYFLAPNPALDKSTADFRNAYGGKYDDISWALWGLSEGLYNLLLNASDNLTRQNFIAKTQQARISTQVYPGIDFPRGGGHFGGTAAWSQKVDCNGTQPNQNQPGTWLTSSSTYYKI